MHTRIHISLEVSDLDAAIQFYSVVFRVPPTKRRRDYANYVLDTPALHLALEHHPGRLQGNPFKHQHFGIELLDVDWLHSWQDWLQTVGVPLGMPLRVEEQVTCCYAVADKFWLTDPDGHRWEFWVRTDDADRMHGESTPAATDVCCFPIADANGEGARAVEATKDSALDCCDDSLRPDSDRPESEGLRSEACSATVSPSPCCG